MSDITRVVLIGGTSHVGKSTFARALAHQMDWECMSADSLARHPGRPWRDEGEVPEVVKVYYLSCKPENLLEDVISHYRCNVWPIAEAVVRARVSNPFDSCLVLEGSAIWPDCVLGSRFDHVWSAWLTAKPDTIVKRIRENSRYLERSHVQQALIDAFLYRSLAFNERVMESANRLGQRCVDVTIPGALDQLSQECASIAKG